MCLVGALRYFLEYCEQEREQIFAADIAVKEFENYHNFINFSSLNSHLRETDETPNDTD